MATICPSDRAEPGESADDQPVAGLQGVRQLVQPAAALLGSLSGGGRLDEVVDVEVVLPRVLQDGEVLAARATFIEADRREIAMRRGAHNRLGFAYQVAFVRVLGRFPRQTPLEIDGEILRFAALQLGADAETVHAYARRQ